MRNRAIDLPGAHTGNCDLVEARLSMDQQPMTSSGGMTATPSSIAMTLLRALEQHLAAAHRSH